MSIKVGDVVNFTGLDREGGKHSYIPKGVYTVSRVDKDDYGVWYESEHHPKIQNGLMHESQVEKNNSDSYSIFMEGLTYSECKKKLQEIKCKKCEGTGINESNSIEKNSVESLENSLNLNYCLGSQAKDELINFFEIHEGDIYYGIDAFNNLGIVFEDIFGRKPRKY